MRVWQIQSSKQKPIRKDSEPWWPRNSNFLIVLYAPLDTFYFRGMWEEGEADDFIVDFFDAGQTEFPHFKSPLNIQKWNGVGFQEWAGRLKATEVLSHRGGVLNLKGEKSPNLLGRNKWTVTSSMMDKIREWVIVSAPQLVPTLTDIKPFGGPA